jgi:hypothetical protein
VLRREHLRRSSGLTFSLLACAALAAACSKAVIASSGETTGAGGAGGGGASAGSSSGATSTATTTTSSSGSTVDAGAACEGGPSSLGSLAPLAEAQAGYPGTGVDIVSAAFVPGGAHLLVAGDFWGSALTFGQGISVLAADGGATSNTIFLADVLTNGSWVSAESFPSTGDVSVTAMVVDPQGNAYLTGSFSGSVTFDKTLTSGDGFLVKLDPQHVPLWSMTIGDDSRAFPGPLALDSAGNVFLGGMAQTGYTLSFAGSGPGCSGVTVSNGPGDVFPYLVKLGPEGTCVWLDAFAVDVSSFDPLGGDEQTLSLAVDPSDDVILVGSSDAPNNFGTPVSSVDPAGDGTFTVFVAKFSGQTGEHVWDEAFGAPGDNNQIATNVALDPCGDVLVAGYVGNPSGPPTATFGSLTKSLGSGPAWATAANAFLAKLHPNGQAQGPLTPVWLQVYGELGRQWPTSLIVDGASNILLAGGDLVYTGGTGLRFGTGAPIPYLGPDAGGSYATDSFVALLDPSGDLVRGLRTSCASSPLFPLGGLVSPVAADGQGQVAAVGAFTGTCDLGPGVLPPLVSGPGSGDLFVVEYGP